MTQDQLNRIFALQKANVRKLATESAKVRIGKLKKLKQEIIKHRAPLIEAMHLDFHKPAAEVEMTEIHPVLDELNHAICHLKSWMKPHGVKTPLLLVGSSSEVRYEPKGMVLIISPWNYPFNLVFCPLIAAVAAGNTVMVRPSEKVPHTSKVIEKIIQTCFLESEVQLFEGSVEFADQLLQMPFDHIFFTGSTSIGKKVFAHAVPHLSTVTLELGGKSPTIVGPKADVAKAAQRITWAKLINAGQTCIAPDYVFVHEEVAEEFLRQSVRYIEEAFGKTFEERKKTLDLAHVIDARSFDRLTQLVKTSLEEGARLIVGGKGEKATLFLEPTLLDMVKMDDEIMKEEIFGPVLPILRYRNIDSVLEYIRSKSKPLSLYIFSEDQKFVENVLQNTTAGGVTVNHSLIHFVNSYLPFGGVGASGQGRYHGFYGFQTFSNTKAVLKQGKLSMVDLMAPPYGTDFKKWLLRILKYLE